MGEDKILTRATILVLLLGVFARVCSAQGELWFDEIWSLELVRDVTNWVDILVLNHDNNHILNSLWLWILGPNHSTFAYRACAVLCSSLSVLLLGAAAIIRKDRAMLIWAWLFALSYPIIVLGSEARGYGPLMLFVISAWLWITRKNFKDSFRDIFVLGTISSLGALSHPTWVFILPGIVSYFLLADKKILLSLAFSLFPSLLLIWAFYSDLEIGGGPHQMFLEVILNQVSALVFCSTLTLQNIAVSAALFLGAFVVLVAGAFGIFLAGKPRGRETGSPGIYKFPIKSINKLTISLFTTIFLTTALSILILKPEFLLPRYLTIPGIFLLYSLSIFLERNLKLSFVLLIAFSFISLLRVQELHKLGRGNFVGILEPLKERQEVRLGTNQFFQVGKLLSFYRPDLDVKILNLRPKTVPPDFYIISQHNVEVLPPENTKFFGYDYSLEGQALSAPYTGPSWIIYQLSQIKTKPH